MAKNKRKKKESLKKGLNSVKRIIQYKVGSFFRRIFWGIHLDRFQYRGDYIVHFLITGHTVPDIQDSNKWRSYKTERISRWKQFLLGYGDIKSYFSDITHGGWFKTGYSTKKPYGHIKVLSDAVLVVTIHNIDSASEAIFYAKKTSDELLSRLSLTHSHAWKNNVKSKDTGVSHYPYKGHLVRIAFKRPNGFNKRLRLYTTHTGTQVCGPKYYGKDWNDPTAEKFFEDISKFRDPVFEMALHYLYPSEQNRSILDFAISDMKCIEVILNDIGSESNKFKKNLKIAKPILGISDEFEEKLQKLWEQRSKTGDIAHPRPAKTFQGWLGQRSMMQQYGGYTSSESVLLLMKYYHYKKKIYTVWVGDLYKGEKEYWSEVVNHHQTYSLNTDSTKQSVWKQKIKEYFADKHNVKQSKVTFLEPFTKEYPHSLDFQTKIFVDYEDE